MVDPAAGPDPGMAPPLVAIIDDDEPVGAALGGLVRSLGYAAAIFMTAEAFLRAGRLQGLRCLVTDMQMPGMNGIELQRRLRARDDRLPIIFVTAFPDERLREQAMAGGAAVFLGKPFDTEEFVHRLQMICAAQG